MNGSSFSAAVVGAGPAGLAAALRLRAAGASVTVYDAAPGAGGRACTHEVDGFRVDPAVQLVSASYTNFARVLRACGADGLLQRSPGRDALWRKGRAHEVVYGSTSSMLASGALPLALKLRMGAQYLPFLQRHAGSLDLCALERAAATGLDGESVAAWGARELGRDFVDLLAAPLLATLYGCAPDEASAGFYHALAREGMSLEVQALRGGIGGLGRAAAERLASLGAVLRFGEPVLDVQADETRAIVRTAAGEEVFGAVVVAVPAPAALEIAKFLTPTAVQALGMVRVRPAATLALLLDRPAGVRWFGLSYAGGESREAAAACVQENKVAGLVPPGKGLLTVFALPHAAERLDGADAGTAARMLLPDVARALPGIERRVQRAELYTWRDGWTVFGPGSLGRLPALRAAAWGSAARAVLAGDYLYAPTVEGAVTAGLDAADRIVARFPEIRGA
ncbi:FAD-dependent oxidoreductase [Longimicrobium terrae]|uniref:Oxygen-dependent protoporphyrinogen oxidase n=1 Tax=Longimicrobium terrae TaxID=1639882 RepID=A0A841GVR3_9BACT|nr:FAD-dependent oxidoreductase [Longimicrobium terrae]MBB4634115.1 oxygen-dependent protoporphyrinogen oxidase [Longimicrobium terrae]MBB6068995.1 oxygen-dependent protoporphyrinogen oxidase [Longimicrobium terrae]NNC28173.1 NAD(P)-binding protein [Longimicrobium terrae]